MNKILFISPGETYLNHEEISYVLDREGYEVQYIELDSIGKSTLELSGYNLAIIHLHPDIPASWGEYLDLKHQFPGFPILVFMPHHTVHRLTSEICHMHGRKTNDRLGA